MYTRLCFPEPEVCKGLLQPNIRWLGLTKQIINEGLSSRRQPLLIPQPAQGAGGESVRKAKRNPPLPENPQPHKEI